MVVSHKCLIAKNFVTVEKYFLRAMILSVIHGIARSPLFDRIASILYFNNFDTKGHFADNFNFNLKFGNG